MKKYYEAYEERYKTAHEFGVSWMSDEPTPIVLQTLEKMNIDKSAEILEIGCGEGRDARSVLEKGYNLLATDISQEAVAYCAKRSPRFEKHFQCLNCIDGTLDKKFDFIYAIAVLHMFVLDEDRAAFYSFVKNHLAMNGVALVCSMGDGQIEMRSDIATAFDLQERQHPSGIMKVAGTSCRMVSFSVFEREIEEAGLNIIERGITQSMPEFNCLMYALIKA